MMGKDNKGFTLIELLVVISIIALLSSIILSAVKDARDKAATRAFEQELVQVRNAMQIYREKNNGAWPPSLDYIINNSANRYVSFDTLIPELYSSGVYNKDTISTPSFISTPIVLVGQQNANYTGRYHTCNTEEGNQFALVFRNSASATLPVTHASLDYKGYWNGSAWIISDGLGGTGHSNNYDYCLNVK